jgi:hypothetical protein
MNMPASIMQRLLDVAGWDAGSTRHKQLEDAMAGAGLALVDRAVDPAQGSSLSDDERHAIAHARHQVENSSPEHPNCYFDYELVRDLLRVIDRRTPAECSALPNEEADGKEAIRLLDQWTETKGAEDQSPYQDTMALLGKENSAGWVWAREVRHERDFDAEQERTRKLAMEAVTVAEEEAACLRAQVEGLRACVQTIVDTPVKKNLEYTKFGEIKSGSNSYDEHWSAWHFQELARSALTSTNRQSTEG